MIKYRQLIGSFLADPTGATAIEYGLIAAGIALAIALSVFTFGDNVASLLYDDLTSVLHP